MNSTQTLKFAFPRNPYIVMLLSIIYSVIYIIFEVIVTYQLSEGQTIEGLKTYSYFDIVPSSFSQDFFTPMVISSIVSLVSAIFFFLISKALNQVWFARAKGLALYKVSRYLGIFYLFCLSIVSSASPNLELIFIPIVCTLTQLFVGLSRKPLPQILVTIYWYIILLLLTGYIVLISSNLIITVNYSLISHSGRIFLVYLTGMFAAIFAGSNKPKKLSKVRLIGNYHYPYIVRALTPFIITTTSLLFPVIQVTLATVSCFFLAAVLSLFGMSVITISSPLVFAVNVICTGTQLIPSQKADKEWVTLAFYLLSCFVSLLISVLWDNFYI